MVSSLYRTTVAISGSALKVAYNCIFSWLLSVKCVTLLYAPYAQKYFNANQSCLVLACIGTCTVFAFIISTYPLSSFSLFQLPSNFLFLLSFYRHPLHAYNTRRVECEIRPVRFSAISPTCLLITPNRFKIAVECKRCKKNTSKL